MVTSVKLHAEEGSPAFFTEAYFTKPQSPDTWAMTHYGEASLDLFHGTPLDAAVPGGRVVWTGSGTEMHYFTTDHLGSTRLVTDSDGNVLEQFDYLPYGQKCNNSSLAVANQHKTDYLYTGKELPDAFFGIDWYDSIARWQTTSGVFTSSDPLAEEYYPLSPNNYCAGDPEGMTKLVFMLLLTAGQIVITNLLCKSTLLLMKYF